jgi:Cof subfamily protein (haloacid dehalogenase superfamily)
MLPQMKLDVNRNNGEDIMYKLIAMDLDDTLLNDSGIVSERNKDAIRRAEAAGTKIIITSGRSYASTKQFIHELGLADLTISLNGAYIQDPTDDKLVADFSIEKEITGELLKAIEPYGIHVNFYNGEKVYCQEPTEHALYYSQLNRIEINYVDSLWELSKTKPAGKLLLINNEGKLEGIRDLLREKFGDHLNLLFSKPFFLEIFDRSTSKGAALRKVAEMYGIKPEEIISVGDGENDLSMIKMAGIGAAVSNAKEAVKQAADYITLSNNESGVAHLIEKFILGDAGDVGR